MIKLLSHVSTTFVEEGSTFWANQINDQVITVVGNYPPVDQSSQMSTLCSTMKLDESLEPEPHEGNNNPYLLMVQAEGIGHHGDSHKVSQKEKVWINITSEYGTPILKAFIQVRPTLASQKAVGKFVSTVNPQGGHLKLIDCFGGKENGILFENDKRTTISDVSILWEAPHNETGDFAVV